MEDFIWIVLDLLMILIIVLFGISGKQKGFAATVISFIGVFASAVIAFILSSIIGEFVFNTFIANNLSEHLYTTIESTPLAQGIITTDGVASSIPMLVNSITAIVDSITEGLPSFLGDIVDSHISDSGIENIVPSVVTSIDDIVNFIVLDIVKPVVMPLINGIILIILFVILLVLFAFMAKSAELIKYIPFIGGVNALLGGIIGVISGLVVVFILANLISVVAMLSGGSISFLTPQIIRDTFIVDFMTNLWQNYRVSIN